MFTKGADRTSAERLTRFHREVVERDLSLTHTIIQPAIDKGVERTAGHERQSGGCASCGRNGNGVIVRGAKVLATLGPFADELFVYPASPLPPGPVPITRCASPFRWRPKA